MGIIISNHPEDSGDGAEAHGQKRGGGFSHVSWGGAGRRARIQHIGRTPDPVI